MKHTAKMMSALTIAFLAVAGLEAGKSKESESHAVSAKYAEGLEVKTKKGVELGTLRDIVIDPSDGSIDFYIVDTGVFGIGGEEKVVPASRLKHPGKGTAHFTYMGSENGFRNTHALDSERTFSENMEAAGSMAFIAERLVPAMETVRHSVYAEGSESVGRVESWLIDANRNEAPYLIVRDVRFGMTYGSGYDYFLVEADAIKSLERADGGIHLNVTEEVFSNAPKLSDSEAVETIEEGGVTVFRYEVATL